MSSNPYAPPAAAVADIAADAQAPAYFPISIAKLVLMCFGTLGFYQYYWFYRNWTAHKQRTGEDIFPFWRTVFGVIFCYPLVRRIGEAASGHGLEVRGLGWWAAAWIIPSLLWRLPDPYWLVTYLSIFALIPVQRVVNRLNAQVAPGHDANARLNGWNWLAVFPGLPVFALAVWGTFFPEG